MNGLKLLKFFFFSFYRNLFGNLNGNRLFKDTSVEMAFVELSQINRLISSDMKMSQLEFFGDNEALILEIHSLFVHWLRCNSAASCTYTECILSAYLSGIPSVYVTRGNTVNCNHFTWIWIITASTASSTLLF
jgi:hypothetical protein